MLRLLCAVPCLLVACIWIMPLRDLIPEGGEGFILRTISAALHRFFVCSSVLTSALDAQLWKQKRPPFTGGVIVLVCGERGIRTLVTFP